MRSSTSCPIALLLALGAALPAQQRFVNERSALEDLHRAKTPEQLRRRLLDMGLFHSEAAAQAVAQVLLAADDKDDDTLSAGMTALRDMESAAAYRTMGELAKTLRTPARRHSPVGLLCDAALAKGQVGAVSVFDALLVPDPTHPDVAPYAATTLAKSIPYHPEHLEELAALPAGGVQAKAAAEVQRLKALANLPIIDTARLDRWKTEKVQHLESELRDYRERAARDRRNQAIYASWIRATGAYLARIRSMPLLDLGVETLGEYYDATAQSSKAVQAVATCNELADACKDLPTLTGEHVEGFVDRRGEFHVDGRSEWSIDLGAIASGLFASASAMQAVDAVRAREIARTDRGLLACLTEPTLDAIRAKYVARLASNPKIQAVRAARARAGK